MVLKMRPVHTWRDIHTFLMIKRACAQLDVIAEYFRFHRMHHFSVLRFVAKRFKGCNQHEKKVFSD